MKGHLYEVSIEHLEDARGIPIEREPLVFRTRNHDDLFKIVEAMKSRAGFDEMEASTLAVGIKLFGEVMLGHRHHPLFQDFHPHFAAFMGALKRSGQP